MYNKYQRISSTLFYTLMNVSLTTSSYEIGDFKRDNVLVFRLIIPVVQVE